jgi:hypothetical protein
MLSLKIALTEGIKISLTSKNSRIWMSSKRNLTHSLVAYISASA